MKLNLDRIRSRQKDLEKKKNTGNYFKPQTGKNLVRVLPFNHKVTKRDAAEGFFDKKLVGKVVTEIDREVVRMFGASKSNRPLIVTNQNQPAMKRYRELKNSRSQSDQNAARSMRPTTCYYLNVVDTKAQKPEILEYAAPKTVYEAILGYILDEDYGSSVIGIGGRDFVIQYDPAKEGTDKYSVRIRAEGKSTKLPADLEEKAHDFYDPTVFAGLGEFEEVGTNDGEDEDDEPRGKGVPTIQMDEDDDEEEEDEDIDEEDEEKEDKDEDDDPLDD